MEKVWEYNCNLTFNSKKITKFTITDHFQKKHSELKITLIVELINKLDGKEVELTDYLGKRKVFKWKTTYQGKNYRLIFWLKDNTDNHLWIRNCYRVD